MKLMLNLTIYQRNANQNHNDIPLYTLKIKAFIRMAFIKQKQTNPTKITIIDKDMENWNPCSLLVGM
jgi:hypothetical protein